MAKYSKECGPDIKQRDVSIGLTKGGGFEDKGYKLGTSGGYECASEVKGCAPDYSPKDPNRD